MLRNGVACNDRVTADLCVWCCDSSLCNDDHFTPTSQYFSTLLKAVVTRTYEVKFFRAEVKFS